MVKGGTWKMTMYLVEGRNLNETRGQYVLTKVSAYSIFEEMKKDFKKVSIYEKENGEYKRIEKYERPFTNNDWLNSLTIEDKAEVLRDMVIMDSYGFCDKTGYDEALVIKEWLEKEYKED